MYEAPRELLRKISDLLPADREGADALCCGGSLGLMNTSLQEKDKITKNALQTLLAGDPEILVTACPLCKKTFSKHSTTEVRDLAELVHDSIPGRRISKPKTSKEAGIVNA